MKYHDIREPAQGCFTICFVLTEANQPALSRTSRHMRPKDRVWNSRDIPPCPKELGEQERLPQGGPSSGPFVGALDLRFKRKEKKVRQTKTKPSPTLANRGTKLPSFRHHPGPIFKKMERTFSRLPHPPPLIAPCLPYSPLHPPFGPPFLSPLRFRFSWGRPSRLTGVSLLLCVVSGMLRPSPFSCAFSAPLWMRPGAGDMLAVLPLRLHPFLQYVSSTPFPSLLSPGTSWTESCDLKVCRRLGAY
jgi:hypothetical protein